MINAEPSPATGTHRGPTATPGAAATPLSLTAHLISAEGRGVPNGTRKPCRLQRPYFANSRATPHHQLRWRRHHHPACPSTPVTSATSQPAGTPDGGGCPCRPRDGRASPVAAPTPARPAVARARRPRREHPRGQAARRAARAAPPRDQADSRGHGCYRPGEACAAQPDGADGQAHVRGGGLPGQLRQVARRQRQPATRDHRGHRDDVGAGTDDLGLTPLPPPAGGDLHALKVKPHKPTSCRQAGTAPQTTGDVTSGHWRPQNNPGFGRGEQAFEHGLAWRATSRRQPRRTTPPPHQRVRG